MARFSRDSLMKDIEADRILEVESLSLKPVALTEIALPTAPGVTGTPRPYRFRTDDYLTVSLLVGFFLLVWVVVRSWRYMNEAVKDFFHPATVREARSDDDERLRGAVSVLLLTAFSIGILHFDYLQDRHTPWLPDFSPYVVLGAGMVLTLAYFGVTLLLYTIVNHTLYDARRAALWIDVYFFTVLLLAIVLLPLSLLVVYFDLSFESQSLVFLSALILTKIMLLFRCWSIFFSSGLGFLRIILYFCTLEIVPAIFLWRSLSSISDLLTIVL